MNCHRSADFSPQEATPAHRGLRVLPGMHSPSRWGEDAPSRSHGRRTTASSRRQPPVPCGRSLVSLLLLTLGCTGLLGDTLWEIGRQDDQNAEFALAPGSYSQFRTDAFYVIGESNPKRDWPYAQPGPVDAWGGGRPHTFTIRFGLKSAPADGTCRLSVFLLDTQAGNPPLLRLDVNGHATEKRLQPGTGDASIFGNPAAGRRQKVEVEFPARQLRDGDNDVHLTTLSGSWLLYDGVRLEAPGSLELVPARSRTALVLAEPIRALRREGDGFVQPVQLSITHQGAEAEALVKLGQSAPVRTTLKPGLQALELAVAAVDAETRVPLTIESAGLVMVDRTLTIKPVRHLTVYVLPHSHTDIGYTELQTAIEEKQVSNLLRGMEIARKTAEYPEGARFVWNVEVLWAADLYLRRLGPAARDALVAAVKNGQVALNGMYLNELTGLCRPEELLRLFRFTTQLAEETGVPVRSAMISDVPGYTWATVTAMAQAGVRYFSVAPNYFDRIGDILQKWENKPFYWVSPSGSEKVLVWIPWRGYAMSHIIHQLTPRFVEEYQQQLEASNYDFDIAHMRWAGHGDNAVPDAAICEFIKDWNTRYAWPRFVISSTSEAFTAFEQKYGSRLPEVRGDWTPYWEDGAGSSSFETGLNRASSDRVSQAEALWAMLDPGSYPAAAFEEAWRSVLLYSEHTWGAWCSVSEPSRSETLDQWTLKKGYAAQADLQSRELLSRASALKPGAEQPNAIDLWNTASWPRTELVLIPRDFCEGLDQVQAEGGGLVPSQRLVNGDLVMLADDLPPFAGRRYALARGPAHVQQRVAASGNSLENDRLKVVLDEKTGAIRELRFAGLEGNLVDTASGESCNDYRYFVGDNPVNAQRNGDVTIRVKERGPLVASLLVESPAPGCFKLIREIRLVAGQDYVEIINTVDKQRLVAGSYHAQEGKESLNFAFPFRVPEGQVRIELPFAVIRPDADQMPSACKNWFTAGRWADVANDEFGVTWVTLDAPLVQVGGLTANLLNSQSNPDVWLKRVGPTQKLYSWAMNNHWGTNYRAYQEGPVVFRYFLRPHRAYDPVAASRFAIAQSQPLIPVRARGGKPDGHSRLRLTNDEVLVTGLKPADDGRALVLRVWGASGRAARTGLTWSDPAPVRLAMSDLSEKAKGTTSGDIEVPAWGVVSLRAELPAAGGKPVAASTAGQH